jgi:dihydrofolate synthase / folylpolyglutamate synthase
MDFSKRLRRFMMFPVLRHTTLAALRELPQTQQAFLAEQLLADLVMSRIRLGTERMKEMAEALGQPQNAYPVVHVAGTNGKGSVVAMLTAIAVAQGLKVGSTVSPHLCSPRERVCINGKPLPQEAFIEAVLFLAFALQGAFPDEEEAPTYFEFMTLLAFCTFAKEQVALAVIEVGLGGRLDATNIIEKSACCVVTSIGYDHMALLGDTLTDIAREKGGIFRPNAPVVLGPNLPPEARETLLALAEEANASLVMEVSDEALFAEPWQAENLFSFATASQTTEGAEANEPTGRVFRNLVSGHRYELGLLGSYQRGNMATVLGCIDVLRRQSLPITQEAVHEGLRQVRWAGRFQWFAERRLLLDGSHNKDGFASLKQSLEEAFPPSLYGVFLMVSLRQNREPDLLLDWLHRLEHTVLGVVCTESEAKSGTFHTPMQLRRLLRERLPHLHTRPIWAATDVKTALFFLQRCVQGHQPNGQIQPKKALALVTGSLYTAGEVLMQIEA